jgi:hypothetical protein
MDHTSETAFLSALCVMRPHSYLVWSITPLLGVGLTDLSHFGRHFGQNKAVVVSFQQILMKKKGAWPLAVPPHKTQATSFSICATARGVVP